ncbi:MAG: NitT/TauT family transport system permease protein [Alphaproteobacteria bacterium]|jgi:NitT/TauT family transport system permease protein|nr:NitT/TauT family transport system permease protein [Alphaproteobacteria bacterium]
MTATQVRLVRLALIVLLVALWEFYARFVSTSSLIAGPSDVAMAWWPKVAGEPRVLTAVGVTLIELIAAFAMAVVFGMLIGIAIGLGSIGRRSFYPIVLLLYGIPQAILLPLFVLMFGLGPASKIAFGFSHGVFPVIVTTIAGMRNVSPLLMGGAAAMGATRAQLVRYVIFPHMVTTVFAGLRLAMTLTLLGVVLAEIFVSQGGIGFFTLLYSETFNPAALMALVLTLALMAIALNELVRMVEARFSRWKD